MKKTKTILTLTLALIYLCTAVFAVSAENLPFATSPAATAASYEEAPQIVDITPREEQEDGDVAMLAKDGETAEDEIQEENQQPDVKKDGNTPYFVGAIIAVLVFIGVVLYCKFNGGGNMR
jgi:hypothetical protein